MASPGSSATDGEAVRLPSFSLSPSVKGVCSGTAVLELKCFECFFFCFGPMSIKRMKTPKNDQQTNTFQMQQLFLPSPLCIVAASVMLSSHNALVRTESNMVCPEFYLFTPCCPWLFLQCHCRGNDIIVDQHPAQKEEEFELFLH